ncbi:MAG: NADH-quinone oxidoreductase subunit NuoG [Gammaproteobacteria bacterium]|jgi:NADH-quinone oxidoreductase subunit G|nr:NADH-quinone oxidoreductase subunit NuoG [Gammaproteobacteria bacterium]
MVDIEIEIDGKVVHGNSGESIISIADREGIEIPRFCYHKKLSVSANCRMCLVDIKGNPKPQPACSTLASAGMKLYTKNAKAKAAQKAVMEFLLINHPLDCPICDQGGECELQDVAMEYGSDISKFSEGKRIVADKDIGALIHTDMTRCIHCTRCVRFGAEVAGIVEMGGTGRGEGLKIEPFLSEGIQSELSGNMIDVCPVGALTSKPFRFEVRSWQMNSIQSVARHDLVGSNIFAQTHKGKVKRIVARGNESVNETWISDRDRFSYQGLESEKRCLTPKIKVNNQWRKASWQEALDFAAKGIKNNNSDGSKFGALTSKNATLEELYLLQKLTRGLGSDNLDYRLDFANPVATEILKSSVSLAELEGIDHALIVGSYLRLEQPMINHRIRKATLNGAGVSVINSQNFDFNYRISNNLLTSPQKTVATLSGVLKAVLNKTPEKQPDYLNSVVVKQVHKDIADNLLNAENAVVIVGEHVNGNPQADEISQLVKDIAQASQAQTLNVSLTSNSLAAEQVGFKPVNGKNALEILASDLNSFVMFDIYPDFDCFNPESAIENLSRSDAFVVSLNSFEDDSVLKYSDVVLPIASFYETSGTHINIDNIAQSYSASVKSAGDSKPGWKVVKVLADLLEIQGFEFTNSTEVADEALTFTPATSLSEVKISNSDIPEISIVWQYTPYVVDAFVRHSSSLQETEIGKINAASISKTTAKLLELSEGDLFKGVPVNINNSVAEGCVFVHTCQPRKR